MTESKDLENIRADRLKVTYVTELEPDALYIHYTGDGFAQQVGVFLDLATGDLTIETDPIPGGSKVYGEYENVVLRWPVPTIPTAKTANEILDAVAPIARRILSGAKVHWENGTRYGYLDTDGERARGEAQQAINRIAEDGGRVVETDAADYLHYFTLDELGITADTTDEELERIAAEQAEEAKSNPFVCQILFGCKDYLTGLRDELREARSLQ